MAICGTRPEAVKLHSIIAALRRRQQRTIVISTGQHKDLTPRMLAEFGLAPDMELSLQGADTEPAQLLGVMLLRLAPVLRAYRPALILVQGDTLSALAGALAGAYAGIPVVHVEAGLRTGSLQEPFPEEMQRCLITPVAALHFAPTARAAEMLRREGVPAERIHITGNSGIDALQRSYLRVQVDAELQQRMRTRFPFCAADDRQLVLMTIHRRENIGDRMTDIAAAVRTLAAEDAVEIILPLHPNPAVRQPLLGQLAHVPHVSLVEPLDHAEMVWLMQRASLLLTDSGGLQEEAPSFGLRTLVLRRLTERMEAVDAGIARLSTLAQDEIIAAARELLRLPRPSPCQPFGDGRAGERIAGHITGWLAAQAEGVKLQTPPAIASVAENPESWLQLAPGHPA